MKPPQDAAALIQRLKRLPLKVPVLPDEARIATRRYWIGIGRIVVIVVLWSTIGLTVRLMEDASALEVSAGRSGVMTVVLLIWLVMRKDKVILPSGGWTGILPSLTVASFYTIGSTCTIVAFDHTRVANVACIGATAPLIAAIVAPRMIGERTTAALWFACSTALIGVVIVVGPGAAGSPNAGDIAAFCSAVLFGCQIVALRRFHRVDLAPAYIVGGLATALVGVALNGGFSISWHDALLIMFMGTVQQALPALMLLVESRYVPAVHMAIITLLDVVLGPWWVWVFVGERVTLIAACGAALIVASVAFAALRNRQAA